MPIFQYTVFEQYEFKGYLITIQNHRCSKELEAFAVPTKYSHLFNDIDDIYDAEDVLERNGFEVPNFDEEGDGDYTFFEVDPFDTDVRLNGIDTENASELLDYIIDEMAHRLGVNSKRIVLKQVSKKAITPKSSPKKRGFLQSAWSNLVRLRDGKCMECSSVYDLHAHHIKSFKDNESLRYDVNNGITLCGECHRKWHKENGK